ncbi:MAG: glycosyltransferase family 4 protein, partial [Bacteroidales bacterium]|nr:glycosyltransferase family 4 protein [Bacteroidales bacterium]
MMRIAYIYPALTTVGGADRVIVNKANYLADKCGYEVYIITAHQCGRPVFFPMSDKIKHIDMGVDFNAQYRHSFFVRGAIYFYLLRQYKQKLSRLLCQLKLDIVITTISRDIDFLHSIQDGSIKIAEAHTAKDFIRNYHLLRQGNILYRLVGHIWTRRLERAIKKFNVFVVLTQRDAEAWSTICKPLVIHNSIPFVPERISDISNKQLIAVGRLYEEKGFERLVKAWSIIHSRYPGWSIQLYGNGELKEDLIRQMQEEQVLDSF